MSSVLQIVLDDDHQPMVVNDEDEFSKVLSVTWLPADGEWSAAQLKQCVLLPLSQSQCITEDLP